MHLIATRFGLAAALALVLTVVHTVRAQTIPPSLATAASGPTPSERVQRDADKVFQMILQHGDKPRRAPAATDVRAAPRPAATRPAPAATAATARPVEPRATVQTPSAATRESAKPTQPDTATAASPSAEPAAIAPESLAAPDASAAVPVAALAPVAVAAPKASKLELVSSVEPEFPARLVRQLGKGSVTVNFEVRPDGTVARTEVANTSHRGLNEAALAAVAAWRFKPISEPLPGVVELKFE